MVFEDSTYFVNLEAYLVSRLFLDSKIYESVEVSDFKDIWGYYLRRAVCTKHCENSNSLALNHETSCLPR